MLANIDRAANSSGYLSVCFGVAQATAVERAKLERRGLCIR